MSTGRSVRPIAPQNAAKRSSWPAHTTIGYPGKSPYIFASGGLDANGTGVRAETQRGVGLDLLAPSVNVWIPDYTASTGVHEYVQGTGNSWARR